MRAFGHGARARRRVWDWWVRLSHWLVLAAVIVASVTGFLLGSSWLGLHVLAGALIGALVLARVVWGFAGGDFARFSGFVSGPRAVFAHLQDLRQGRVHRHLGHNPLGAAMIVALLAVLAGLVGSGAMLLGDRFGAGPLAQMLGSPTGRLIAAPHQALAVILLILIGLHVAGALFESWRSRENLVAAMVSGDKSVRPGDAVPKPARARPLLAVGVTVVLLGATFGETEVQRALPLRAAPVDISGSLYLSDCADCHAAFHPSLLPATSWTAIMAHLDDHFGEDASIGAADVAEITAYLAANAAGVADSKPSRVFQQVSAADPLRITATPFWQRTHAGIDPAQFRQPGIAAKSNCAACHADAGTGWFYPGAIDIPEVTETGATP